MTCFVLFEIVQLFSVVLYVITSVIKFDFRLAINAKPNKLRPVERSWGDRDACFS